MMRNRHLPLSLLALSLVWGWPASASAQSSNGVISVMRETAVAGGGRVGGGNPMSAITVIGEPMGGMVGGSSVTIRGGDPIAGTDTSPPAPDTTPPSGSVTINGGASATNNPTVTLTLAATDNSGTVSQMRFSNDNVTYPPAEPYATSASWTLSSGEGTKTVYTLFADAAGNWSSPVTDSITCDTTPPVFTVTSHTNGAIER